MADEVIYKRSSEIYSYSYDFTPKLPLDAALTSPSAATAVDEAGTDVSSTVLGTKSVSGLVMTYPLIAGTNNKDYTITFNGIGATSADARQWVIEMRVRNKIGGTL